MFTLLYQLSYITHIFRKTALGKLVRKGLVLCKNDNPNASAQMEPGTGIEPAITDLRSALSGKLGEVGGFAPEWAPWHLAFSQRQVDCRREGDGASPPVAL